MKKKYKLQLTFDDLKQEQLMFSTIDSYLLADYLSDFYIRDELPPSLHKTFLLFYLYKLGLSKSDYIYLPYSEVNKLYEFMQEKVIVSKRLSELRDKTWTWLVDNL